MKIDDKIYNYEKTNEELDVDYTTAKRVAAAFSSIPISTHKDIYLDSFKKTTIADYYIKDLSNCTISFGHYDNPSYSYGDYKRDIRQLYTTWTPLIDKADNPNDEENEYANYEIS